MGGLSVARGIIGGIAGAAGDPGTQQEMVQQNQKAEQEKQNALKARVAPLALGIKNLQTGIQSAYSQYQQQHPDWQGDFDQWKTGPGQQQFAQFADQTGHAVHAMREILHPDWQPGPTEWLKTHLTDRMHITNADHRAEDRANDQAWNQYSEGQFSQAATNKAEVPQSAFEKWAAEYKQATGHPPTPEDAQRFAQKQGGILSTLKPTLKEYVSPDGKSRQWFDAADPNSIPEGWQAMGGAGVKPIKGTLVKSSQSPTGFAQTYLDPMNPGKVVAWQPITPSRFYQGTTSNSTTTDPFGVTSTTHRTTSPTASGNVDLSGAAAMPADPEGGEATPGASAPTGGGAPQAASAPSGSGAPPTPSGSGHRQLQATRQAQSAGGARSLDQNGHVPPGAGNSYLVQAANSILDGMDVDKLPIPQRDRTAAMALAQQYGYKGQGLFTPKDSLLLRESGTFLKEATNNPSLSVLDSVTSRARLAALVGDASHKGTLGTLAAIAASHGASPQEQEFLRMYNQLVGTISGLSQLTRSGRVTEASINRLMLELPNPATTNGSADAKQRLARLQKELDVARETGTLSDSGAPAESKSTGTGMTDDEFLMKVK